MTAFNVEDYVRGCTWQLKMVNSIHGFHKLVFDRGGGSFKCFNRSTHYYWL